MWSVAEPDTSWWWESAPGPEPEDDEVPMPTPLDELPSTLIEPDPSLLHWSPDGANDQSQLYAAFWGESERKQRARWQRLRSWLG
jgi:hypothetical protein